MTEAEIQKALLSALATSPAGMGAAFFQEMFVGGFARRADLVMANGKLAAFEIKSERDSLERLAGQLESYARFFEQVTVVCAAKHLAGVRALAPSSVGVWLIDATGQHRVIRQAKTRQIRDKSAWLTFLPVDELRNLLRQKGASTSGTREDLLSACAHVSRSELRDYVLAFMKRRELRIAQIRNKRNAKQRDDSVGQDAIDRRLEAYLRTVQPASLKTALPRRIQIKSSPLSS